MLSNHELSAKLHNANGRLARAQTKLLPVASRLDVTDAQMFIGEVITALCEQAEPMPVIPPLHPPVDPAIAYEEDTV